MTDSPEQSRHAKGATRNFVSIAMTIMVLAVVFGALYFWRSMNVEQNQARPRQAVPVAAIRIREHVAPSTLTAVGGLSAVNEVVLAPEVAGRVTAIDFESGDKVKRGDFLVQLYNGREKADLSATRAAEKLASAQLERTKTLTPLGAESEELLSQRIAEHEQAQAAVEQAESRLQLKKITAPFSGTLGIKRIDLGEYLNPGDRVATLTDLSRLHVEFSVPQQQLSEIEENSLVHVTTDAYPDQVFEARVNTIEPQVDEATRNVVVQASLANPDGRLRPGMYVSASLQLSENRTALMVPITAVMSSAQGNSVVVIKGDNPMESGTAAMVPVQVGQRIENAVIIESGLATGDVVVTEGQNRIQPQAPLKVTQKVELGGGAREIH